MVDVFFFLRQFKTSYTFCLLIFEPEFYGRLGVLFTVLILFFVFFVVFFLLFVCYTFIFPCLF